MKTRHVSMVFIVLISGVMWSAPNKSEFDHTYQKLIKSPNQEFHYAHFSARFDQKTQCVIVKMHNKRWDHFYEPQRRVNTFYLECQNGTKFSEQDDCFDNTKYGYLCYQQKADHIEENAKRYLKKVGLIP